MPTTKSVALLSSPPLLADARTIIRVFVGRGGSIERSFSNPHTHADIVRDLTICARRARKMLGSADRSKACTWARAIGRTPEAVSAALLLLTGEL